MTSDNDGSLSSSSTGSGRPCLMPGAKGERAAAGCKGILVHNNKRSANTHRVSFSAHTSPSSSLQSSYAPGPPRGAHADDRRSHRSQRSGSVAAATAIAETLQLPYYGRRLSVGFGVKSYLHEFYDDPECQRDAYSQDSDADDGFKYCVEPEIQWRRHCGGAYIALGLAMMTAGAVVMAAGHLIPARDPVVDRSANMEVIDRWAVAYNENLASCRYIGAVVFAVGVVFTVVRFWVSVITGGGGGGGGGKEAEKLTAADRDDRDRYRREFVEKRRRRSMLPQACKNGGDGKLRPLAETSVRIPITGSVENVQPDPRAISWKVPDAS